MGFDYGFAILLSECFAIIYFLVFWTYSKNKLKKSNGKKIENYSESEHFWGISFFIFGYCLALILKIIYHLTSERELTNNSFSFLCLIVFQITILWVVKTIDIIRIDSSDLESGFIFPNGYSILFFCYGFGAFIFLTLYSILGIYFDNFLLINIIDWRIPASISINYLVYLFFIYFLKK